MMLLHIRHPLVCVCVCIHPVDMYTDGQSLQTETADVFVDSNGLYSNNDYAVHRIVKPLLQHQHQQTTDDDRKMQNDFTTFLHSHIDKALSDGFNDSLQHGRQQNVASFDVPTLDVFITFARALHDYFLNDERVFDRVYPMVNPELYFTSKYGDIITHKIVLLMLNTYVSGVLSEDIYTFDWLHDLDADSCFA
jgi:hypothetical protein